MFVMRKPGALLCLCLLFPPSGWAQAPTAANREGGEQATARGRPAETPGLTAADVEAFLDGIVPLQLARDEINWIGLLDLKAKARRAVMK